MRKLLSAALLAVVLACSPNTSQTPHPPPQDRDPAPSADLASQDRDFLERAAQGGNAEIAIGGLSLIDGRTKNPAIAAFGRMMMAEHGASNRRLSALAAQRGIVLPDSLGSSHASFDRLADKRLDAFDREFVRVMVDDHHQAILLYRAEASGGLDPALKAFAAQSLPALEAHLARAQELAKSVQGNIPDDAQEPSSDDLVEDGTATDRSGP